MPARRVALACMTPSTDADELSNARLPSFGARRVLASVASDPELRGSKFSLIDFGRPDVETYVQAIESAEPDLLGLSLYVWSTPTLVEVARRIKRSRPDCAIILGGPSARTTLFDLPPYANAHEYADAIVPTDGELPFREIARLPDRSRAALETVPGLDLPSPSGWVRTGTPLMPSKLDDLASPFALGLMPRGAVAYLETYRGCPLSCTFCEWGAPRNAKAAFSSDYLARELDTFARLDSRTVFLLDAGLNLNAQGFRNLQEADARIGYFSSAALWAEVYPSFIKPEHLDFLSGVGSCWLGVGLQSVDPTVLKLHERHTDDRRFESSIRALAQLGNVEIQIIFGLPGDTPEGFLRTLAFARSMPATVRAYHCLVLPDALMTRGRAEWNMRYDPLSLEMISCLGWDPGALPEMRDYLTIQARASGGTAGNFWWQFPRAA